MKKTLLLTILTVSLLLTAPVCPVLPVWAAGGQKAQNTVRDYSAVFDADYYYQSYSDLQERIGHDPDALLAHFINCGMREGRNGSASFQLKAYMYYNPDLMASYGLKDLSAYYLHYIRRGKAAGRKAVFDEGAEFPKDVLGTFSTKYKVKLARTTNVVLAASTLNGTVVQPGQTFSYNDVLGPRTTEKGYVVAPAFSDGEVIYCVGGGICQVSSTLHAAMMVAGIPASQRYQHSRAVDYMPMGLDATVSYGTKDLQFVNTHSFPIVIYTSADDGVLTVTIAKESTQNSTQNQ